MNTLKLPNVWKKVSLFESTSFNNNVTKKITEYIKQYQTIFSLLLSTLSELQYLHWLKQKIQYQNLDLMMKPLLAVAAAAIMIGMIRQQLVMSQSHLLIDQQ